MSYATRATDYARDVVDGRIVACSYVEKACERHLADLERVDEDDFAYYFDVEAANNVGQFVELLPHVKGKWARNGERLTMEPWQCFILGCVFGWKRKEDGLRRYRRVYIEVPRKNAKALALDTPLPTPDGWTTMRDVEVGDVLFDESGDPCTVTNVGPVHFDHDCYRVSFTNGEEIIADAGHQWLTTARVDAPGRRSRAGNRHGESVMTRVRTTDELYETQTYGTREDRNHSVDMPEPLRCDAANLPIDPYVLGAWLGDGTADAGHITCGKDDLDHFVDELDACGYAADVKFYPSSRTAATIVVYATEETIFGNTVAITGHAEHTFRSLLRRVGVWGDKHIPPRYLRASYEQRLALLQGLMDTDGTAAKRGTAQSFTTMNERLADGAAELLASLGIKFSRKEKSATCNGKSLDRPAWRLQFHCFRDETPVFRMERKLERQRHSSETKTAPRSRTVQIASVEPVRPVPVRCIMVDSPSHLFRAGRTMLPTHNSTISAAIGLYMMAADDEYGAEVYSGATTEKQAWEVFGPARLMAKKTPEFLKHYGVKVNAKTLHRPKNASRFEPLIGKPGDGASPSFAITDEYHEHATDDQYDTMVTGMGAREQPIAWVITTAGSDTAGPCYALRSEVVNVLEGTVENDRLFGVIYTIDRGDDGEDDDGDDWTTEEALRKANPNMGVSVFEEYLLEQQKDAVNNPRKQSTFKMKHLNVWVTAASPYFNLEHWNGLEDDELTRADFAGEPCFVGLDLASKLDIAAKVLLFRRMLEGVWHYYAFGDFYIPEMRAHDPERRHYLGWVEEEHLTATPGNIIDHDAIEDDLMADGERFSLAQIGADPHNATQLLTHLMNAGLPVVEVPQTTMHLSEPMKEVRAVIEDDRIHHPPDPAFAWMMSNVTAQEDRNENVFPRKEQPQNKIDAAVALILAMGCALRYEDDESVYESRGLLAV